MAEAAAIDNIVLHTCAANTWNRSGRGACPRRCLDWTSGGKPLFLTCSILWSSISF